MSDNQRGAVLHQVVESILYQTFRFGVECRCGFVENQYLRVLEDGTGNADALALTARQFAAPVAYIRVVSFFGGNDKIVGIGYLGCLYHSFHCGVIYAKRNVVVECIVEKDCFLIYITHQRAEVVHIGILDVYIVDIDTSLVYVIKTG